MAEITSVGITLPAGSSPTVYYNIKLDSKTRVNASTVKYVFVITSSLSASGYLGEGDLTGSITVGGVSSGFVVKSRSSPWYASDEPHTNTVTVTCPSSSGGQAQTVRFYVSSAVFQTSGRIDNSANYVTSPSQTVTKCGAPRNVVTPNTLFEDVVNWYFTASGGTNNSVTGYEVQYQTRPYGGSWPSSWTNLFSYQTTQTTFTAQSPFEMSLAQRCARGNQLRIRIRTKGTAGSSYYSDWTTTGEIRRNRAPTAPQYLNASTTQYIQGDPVTLTWTACTDPDNNMSGYLIQYSLNGETWTELLRTTATSVTVIPTQAANDSTIQYRVAAVDALGALSGWAYSAVITRLDTTTVYYDTVGARHEAHFYYDIGGKRRPCSIYIDIYGQRIPLPRLGQMPETAYLTDENGNRYTDGSGNYYTTERIWWSTNG